MTLTVSQEFKNSVSEILDFISSDVKGARDEHEDLMIIGIISIISDRLREFSLSRKKELEKSNATELNGENNGKTECSQAQ